MNGLMPGSTLSRRGSRPGRLRTALDVGVELLRVDPSVWCAVKIASAQRAAKARPSSDDPACT